MDHRLLFIVNLLVPYTGADLSRTTVWLLDSISLCTWISLSLDHQSSWASEQWWGCQTGDSKWPASGSVQSWSCLWSPVSAWNAVSGSHWICNTDCWDTKFTSVLPNIFLLKKTTLHHLIIRMKLKIWLLLYSAGSENDSL